MINKSRNEIVPKWEEGMNNVQVHKMKRKKVNAAKCIKVLRKNIMLEYMNTVQVYKIKRKKVNAALHIKYWRKNMLLEFIFIIHVCDD